LIGELQHAAGGEAAAAVQHDDRRKRPGAIRPRQVTEELRLRLRNIGEFNQRPRHRAAAAEPATKADREQQQAEEGEDHQSSATAGRG
jgi:hypothetical protein